MPLGIEHDGYRAQSPHAALRSANRRIGIAVLIETVEGVKNVDEIAAVDGVDCIWLGHFDLSASLGIPGEFDHSDFQHSERKIRKAARNHGKALGFLVVSPEQGIDRFRKGYDVICHQTDVGLYRQTLATDIENLRIGCSRSKGRKKQ